MLRRRIFVGSASETREVASWIARSLGRSGFSVERWWETAFEPGDITIDRLRELATECDGAVFVCKGTDIVSKGDTQWSTTRDNVVFETGMFFQSLGRKRCVVVSDSKTRLPTDWNGLTFIPLTEADPLTTSEDVTRHFERQFTKLLKEGGQEPEVHITEADPHLARVTYDGHFPEDWRVRALFFGMEGSRNWLSIDTTEEYLYDVDRRRMRDQTSKVMAKIREVDSISVPTYVSLGPGSAAEDKDLVTNIDPSGTIHYVPIDISEGLLHHAIHQLHDYAHVPFGILCDFEDRTTFIKHRLEGRVKHPILFTLLGNTLGNFDKYENRFMKRIEALLKKGDYLLLEVTTLAPNWELDSDIRSNLFTQSDSMKRFYAQGLARHSRTSVESVVGLYTQLIEVRKGEGDVPGSTAVNYCHTLTPRIIVSNRRYDWNELLPWLEEFAFSILGHQTLQLAAGNIGVGTVLLKKK